MCDMRRAVVSLHMLTLSVIFACVGRKTLLLEVFLFIFFFVVTGIQFLMVIISHI